MIRILLIGTAVVTVLYVLINLAYLHVLGLEGLRSSSAVAAEVMRVGFGATGAVILSLIVVCAALSTMTIGTLLISISAAWTAAAVSPGRSTRSGGQLGKFVRM